MLRTSTSLRCGVEKGLKFQCTSFTEKRNSGRPFYTINYTSASQLCLDKLHNTIPKFAQGEKRPQCFTLRLRIFKKQARGPKRSPLWLLPTFCFGVCSPARRRQSGVYSILGKPCLEPPNHLPPTLGIAPQDLIEVDVFHPVVIAGLRLQ